MFAKGSLIVSATDIEADQNLFDRDDVVFKVKDKLIFINHVYKGAIIILDIEDPMFANTPRITFKSKRAK